MHKRAESRGSCFPLTHLRAPPVVAAARPAVAQQRRLLRLLLGAQRAQRVGDAAARAVAAHDRREVAADLIALSMGGDCHMVSSVALTT